MFFLLSYRQSASTYESSHYHVQFFISIGKHNFLENIWSYVLSWFLQNIFPRVSCEPIINKSNLIAFNRFDALNILYIFFSIWSICLISDNSVITWDDFTKWKHYIHYINWLSLEVTYHTRRPATFPPRNSDIRKSFSRHGDTNSNTVTGTRC